MNAISKAINHVGGQAELARRLSSASGKEISPQVIYNWRMRGNAPPDFAPFFEEVTEGHVLAEEVCSKVPWHIIRSSEGRAA